MYKTRISTKGQVVIPREMREKLGWRPGTELVVEESAGTVSLRGESPVADSTLDEVYGCIPYDGPPVSLEEMDRAIGEMLAKLG